MKLKLLRLSAAAAMLSVLTACIPIPERQDVALSGTTFSQPQESLAPGQGVVIVGWLDALETAMALEPGAAARSADRLAGCVRDAVSATSSQTRIVLPDQFRAAVVGIFATERDQITEAAISDTLRNAIESPAFTALKIRYVFMVAGRTETVDSFSKSYSGGPGAFETGGTRWTYLRVTAWDAMTARKIDSVVPKPPVSKAFLAWGSYSMS
jgi:hypothetical protein